MAIEHKIVFIQCLTSKRFYFITSIYFIPFDPVNCPIPPFPVILDARDGLIEGATAIYSCSPGFQLNGEAERQCVNGAWTGQEPACIGEVVQLIMIQRQRFWTEAILSVHQLLKHRNIMVYVKYLCHWTLQVVMYIYTIFVLLIPVKILILCNTHSDRLWKSSTSGEWIF